MKSWAQRFNEPRSSAQGLTLFEVLMVLAIISIMTGLSVLSIQPQAAQLQTAARNLRTEFLAARAAAIKEYAPVTVQLQPSTDQYNATLNGQLLFQSQLSDHVDLVTNNTSVTFTPLGTASTSTIFLRSQSGKEYEISINGVGRVTVN